MLTYSSANHKTIARLLQAAPGQACQHCEGPRLPQLTHRVHRHFRHKQTCTTTRLCQGVQRAHYLTVWSGLYWRLEDSGKLAVGSEGRTCNDRVHARGEKGRAGGCKAGLLLQHPSNLAIYKGIHSHEHAAACIGSYAHLCCIRQRQNTCSSGYERVSTSAQVLLFTALEQHNTLSNNPALTCADSGACYQRCAAKGRSWGVPHRPRCDVGEEPALAASATARGGDWCYPSLLLIPILLPLHHGCVRGAALGTTDGVLSGELLLTKNSAGRLHLLWQASLAV